MNNLFPSSGLTAPVQPNSNVSLDSLQPLFARQDFLRQQQRDWQLQDENRHAALANIADNAAQNKPAVMLGMTPYQQAQIDLQKSEIASKDKENADKLAAVKEQNTTKNQISQQRADVYSFKAQHPGVKIVAPKGGNIQAINSATGEVVQDFGPSGTLSDEDRINLTGENTMKQIDARTQGNMDVQNLRNTGALDNIAARTAGQINVNDNKPRTPVQPTQVAADVKNKANRLMNTNPELGKFITTDPDTGQIIVTKPGTGATFLGYHLGGETPTQEQYNQITNELYGPGSSSGSGNTTTSVEKPPIPFMVNHGSTTETKPKSNESSAPKAPKGWKYVPKAGGGWTAVKDDSSMSGGLTIDDSTGI